MSGSVVTAQDVQAMPLRIAILRLENELQEYSSLIDQLAQAEIETIHLNEFISSFRQAITQVSANKIVRLVNNHNKQKLLLLPALTAAQLKLHPHAYLAAMQSADSQAQALKLALQQARRSATAISQNHLKIQEEQAVTTLYQLIENIATRTLTHDDGRQHFWFTTPHQARVASLCVSTNQPETTALILTQASGKLAPKSLLTPQRLLFVLGGNTQAQLETKLAQLDKQLTQLQQTDLAILTLMQNQLTEFNQQDNFTITLQASSVKQLQQEIAALSPKLTELFASQGQYKTPAGSYFTAKPLGIEQLAFVYPGVGTVYHQMLNELHIYFPELFARLEQQGNLKAMLQADGIYHQDKQYTAQMPLCDLAIAGVGASYLLTQLLQEEFAIQPRFALGYSMGEAAMWASLGVWLQPQQLIAKTQNDPLFTSVISGELTAVRQAWELDNKEAIHWNSFVVRSSAESIETLLPQYPKVYLAIIQGDTCVIAGCETSCLKLLKQLGKRGIAANRVTAMHTAPALSQVKQVSEFYRQPLNAAADNKIQFLSAANTNKGIDAPLNQNTVLSSTLIADAISQTFCYPLNFTALIQSAARQGARLFIEVGSDRQTSTLIDKILQDESESPITSKQATSTHATIALDTKGSGSVASLLKALAQMISHRLPVKLDLLQQGLERQLAQQHDSESLNNTETHRRLPEEAPHNAVNN